MMYVHSEEFRCQKYIETANSQYDLGKCLNKDDIVQAWEVKGKFGCLNSQGCIESVQVQINWKIGNAWLSGGMLMLTGAASTVIAWWMWKGLQNGIEKVYWHEERFEDGI